MTPHDAYIYERLRHLANIATWSIDLQVRRIRGTEPEDEQFRFRRWIDYHFLIIALSRLKQTTNQLLAIDILRDQIGASISEFDSAFPWLHDLRNVVAHFDEYPIGMGRNKSISHEGTEVAELSSESLKWLGYEIRPQIALDESAKLFLAIQMCGKCFAENQKNKYQHSLASSPHLITHNYPHQDPDLR